MSNVDRMTQAWNARRAIDAVWRIESPRLIAGLVRMMRDVGRAEELAQDALVKALEEWPAQGIPDNPGAWLMTTAKRRAIDELRRAKVGETKLGEVARDLEAARDVDARDVEEKIDEDVGDDLLRLILVACHPVLTTDARVALTLRLLGGLTTEEIARACVTPEPTIAQRIVRAKRTLSDANVAFEVPRGDELAQRLGAVMEVIYLIFNEGYSATVGEDWMRPALCEDALRLGRVLAELVPKEAEIHGLVALMELQASRLAARTRPTGEPVLLLDQDRSRWDRLLIQRGLAALTRAVSVSAERGPYTLQAAIASFHARALTAEATDWASIAEIYGELAARTPSPVIDLNRAVAVSMAHGPARGLEIVDAIVESGALDGYHLLPSVRADLLSKLGRWAEARIELESAIGLTKNGREKRLLEERLALAAKQRG